MSLFFKPLKNFALGKANILLIKDFPALGYEGQVVQVKPGYAKQVLFKQHIAIPHFPGLKKRLYPQIKDDDLEKRKVDYDEVLSFNKKIKNVKLEILRLASFTNPSLLKEELTAKQLIEEINAKFGWEIEQTSLFLDKNITKFGDYKIDITNFIHKKFNFTYNFPVSIKVLPQKLNATLIKSTAGTSTSGETEKKE